MLPKLFALLAFPLFNHAMNILEAVKTSDARNDVASSPKGIVVRVHKPFDFLMLTLIYPEAVCRADDDAVPDSCEIPDGTSKWTLHGLWPNYASGGYPQFCSKEKFNIDDLKPIMNFMRRDWPNLYPKQSVDSLWKHEWAKHGTCAELDPLLSSQFKYFNSSLVLRERFDVEAALTNQGILPSEDAYTYNQLMQAFKAGLSKGRQVQLNCLTDKKTRQTLLGDVRLCFDRQLSIIDCPSEKYIRSADVSREPLPAFKPCRDMIVYIPSQQEWRLEKLTEAVVQVHPGAILVGMRWPIAGVFLAAALLIGLTRSLCVMNYQMVKQEIEHRNQFRAVRPTY